MIASLATVPQGAEDKALTITPGTNVFVSFYDATNTIINTIGHVLAIGELDHEGKSDEGWPSLTIAVPKPDAPPSLLASPRWADGFLRLTGVRHVSHDSHEAGNTPSAWQEIDAPEDAYPKLLDPRPAPPENPTFARHGIEAVPAVSVEQAAAVQSGKAPSSSTVSPLINEPETPVDEGKPSAADLDAVEKEKQVAEATGGTEKPVVEQAAADEPSEEKKPDETQSS